MFFVLLISVAHSLYFYLETNAEKCFTEELPKGTLVAGQYRTEQWNEKLGGYAENPSLGINIQVDELPERKRLKTQKGSSSGKFAFSAIESKRYLICLSTNNTGWFSHEKARVYMDLEIGDEALDEAKPQEKLSELAMRVRDLNHRISDIRREQGYQKEREMEFRDLSELINSRAVYWSIVQIFILGITCVWQLRHLKGFFEAKKLV